PTSAKRPQTAQPSGGRELLDNSHANLLHRWPRASRIARAHRGREGTSLKMLRILMPAIFVIAALVGSSSQASAHEVQLVATINGSGRAVMDDGAPLKGTTTYFIHARLYSDGSAIGRFDCVDLAGSTAEGDFFGPITSWKMVNGQI